MKKFKLNAVLASVLSLGLVCSSSVCASGITSIIRGVLVERCETEVGERKENTRKEIEICEAFEGYKKWRERNVKPDKPEDRVNWAEQLATILVDEVLEAVLDRFPSLVDYWDEKTKSWVEEQRSHRELGNAFSSPCEMAFALSDIGESLDKLLRSIGSQELDIMFHVMCKIRCKFSSLSDTLYSSLSDMRKNEWLLSHIEESEHEEI